MAKKISEIRRPEIISALRTALEEDGMSLPGNDQIAKHGDMSRQLIRHYFKDGEDMMLALCEAMEEVYRDCLVKTAIAARGGSRLTIFLDFYFNYLADTGLPKPADDAVYDALLAYSNTHESVRKRLYDGYSLVQMTFAHEFQVTYPDLPQAACKELAYLVIVTMYGHWKMVANIGFSESHHRVSREALDRLIESYVANYEEPEEP
ncbi:hypothetical protein [Parasphingorhabdus sp.]|uniref:TetR/AcrR family transcriptional regulator n=2 Tax=Parasphingorhabdus sp. TaxID=2709688 RepID=UPI00326348B4